MGKGKGEYCRRWECVLMVVCIYMCEDNQWESRLAEGDW
jgi:hypothetical protein